jgi:hypothetical protein
MDCGPGKEKMRREIERPVVERVFGSLVDDVTALVAKMTIESIDERAFVEGLEVLLRHLHRFAPG